MTSQIIDSDRRPAVLARLRQQLVIDESTQCWNWTGATNHGGYGVLSVTVAYRTRPQFRVHRLMYELTTGSIPSDLTVDHLCRNRVCANPEHMELVTASENVRRAGRAITHCKRGHPFDAQNTRHHRRSGGGTQRVCAECARTKALARYYRLKGTQ